MPLICTQYMYCAIKAPLPLCGRRLRCGILCVPSATHGTRKTLGLAPSLLYNANTFCLLAVAGLHLFISRKVPRFAIFCTKKTQTTKSYLRFGLRRLWSSHLHFCQRCVFGLYCRISKTSFFPNLFRTAIKSFASSFVSQRSQSRPSTNTA